MFSGQALAQGLVITSTKVPTKLELCRVTYGMNCGCDDTDAGYLRQVLNVPEFPSSNSLGFTVFRFNNEKFWRQPKQNKAISQIKCFHLPQFKLKTGLYLYL